MAFDMTLRICFVFGFTITTLASSSSPLILTRLINENKLSEARNQSLVEPKLFLNVTSYSGYLSMDETYDTNTFFWYFPAENKTVRTTPWIVWLQGGPGGSSLFGLFKEIGPFQVVNRTTLELRNHSLWKNYSLLFIDNPIGSGYSFTNNNGYARDMATYTKHLYSALQQFLKLFPELEKAPLYLAGESYAGHYIPALGEMILEEKRKGVFDVPLEGLILGNPVLNREDQTNYTDLFYQWGLIDNQGALAAKSLQEQYTKAVKDKNPSLALKLRLDLLNFLQDMSSQEQLYNILSGKNYQGLSDFESFLRQDNISKAIHVGDREFVFSSEKVKEYLVPEFLDNLQPKMEKLLANNYRVLIYCGQLDLTAPCVPNAAARRQKWHWWGRDEFLAAPRTPWVLNNTVVGYVKSSGYLTEVLIRDSGHLVPLDKPQELNYLITHYIRGLDLPMPINYQTLPSYTPEYIEASESVNTPYKTAYVTSVVFNVVIVLGIVGAAAYYFRMKRTRQVPYVDMEVGM